MTDLVVSPAARPLRGSVPIPADKSIVHRAVMLGALSEGVSKIRFEHPGADNLSTVAIFEALGVETSIVEEVLSITGVGVWGLKAPARDLDCQNSGTTMRLLTGILVAQRFASRLIGDESLTQRPMTRVTKPLRMRGARIEGVHHPDRIGEETAPISMQPSPLRLSPLSYDMPTTSAQVKSCLLLSGLFADGPTHLSEAAVSRDHTERMMSALGIPVRAAGPMVELDPSAWDGTIPAFELAPPGDVSAAAFILAAGLCVPGSQVTVRRVGTNPTRAGFLELIRDMGASILIEAKGDELAEPIADMHVAHQFLGTATLAGERLVRAIDEVPIAAALMAVSAGTGRICDAAELRHKESDRLHTTAAMLRAFGVEVEERADGLEVGGVGDAPLKAAVIDSFGDHRIAMAATVLALRARGDSRIRNADCIAVSFPRFVGTLRALGAEIRVESGASGQGSGRGGTGSNR